MASLSRPQTLPKLSTGYSIVSTSPSATASIVARSVASRITNQTRTAGGRQRRNRGAMDCCPPSHRQPSAHVVAEPAGNSARLPSWPDGGGGEQLCRQRAGRVDILRKGRYLFPHAGHEQWVGGRRYAGAPPSGATASGVPPSAADATVTEWQTPCAGPVRLRGGTNRGPVAVNCGLHN